MLTKAFCRVLILGSCFALFACNTNESEKKIGVATVNPEKVFKDSEAAKAAVNHLNGVSATLNTDLLNLQAIKEKNNDEKKAQEEFDSSFNDLQQQFAAEQQMVTNKVNEIFDKAMESCRKQSGATVVMAEDMVFAKDPSADITECVMKEMNKTPVSFIRVSDAPQASSNGTASVNAISAKGAPAKGSASSNATENAAGKASANATAKDASAKK